MHNTKYTHPTLLNHNIINSSIWHFLLFMFLDRVLLSSLLTRSLIESKLSWAELESRQTTRERKKNKQPERNKTQRKKKLRSELHTRHALVHEHTMFLLLDSKSRHTNTRNACQPFVLDLNNKQIVKTTNSNSANKHIRTRMPHF